MQKTFRSIFSAASIVILINTASAQITMTSNLGKATGGQLNFGNTVSIGASFTTTATGPFDIQQVTLSLGDEFAFGAEGFSLHLYDTSGVLPGTLIETLNYPTILANSNNTFTSSESNVLLANTTYWIVASQSGSGASAVNWNRTTDFDEDPNTWSLGNFYAVGDSSRANWSIGGGFAPQMAIVVPEPSTYALITGVLCLGFVAWKRRRQARASD